MDIAIKAENIGKCYQIGTKQTGSLSQTAFNLLSGGKQTTEDFWALSNVSFELMQGDVLGVVGRNGAGKSTLLKILSRITHPSTGRLEIQGKISSLLEVGTGFHPELTGRENVFLNGTILGMARSEITKKFDEIVQFSGIEKFIDTPVKRFSSGMYVRLAFAVAAHLEPEIMVIDEVLAVGDVAFQKKCLGKMHQIAGVGRTVLFVSHNMQAVRSLCNKGIYLQNGVLQQQGDIETVLEAYDSSVRNTSFDETTELQNAQNRRGLGFVRFSKISMENDAQKPIYTVEIGENIRFMVEFKVYQATQELFCSIALRSGLSREIVTSLRHKLPFENLKPDETYRFECILSTENIRPGEYPIYFWLGDAHNTAYDVVDDIIPPVIVTTQGDLDQLGYDASTHSGYFSAVSQLKISENPEKNG